MTLSAKQTAASVGRAAVVLLLSLSYLSYVFRLSQERVWASGIGGWLDSYFINFLLEHWHQSVWGLTDPSSPPMYFPAQGTLGYSHGLILYAPFYMAVRPFLHPFQAYNLTLFLVLETGIICLYVVFRRFLRLGFIESLLLTTFFFTSQNVINGGTSAWTQRASVFLIPPILLILLVSRRMPQGLPRLTLAGLSGLLFALLLTQDFYTGLFALVLASLAFAAHLAIGHPPPVRERLVALWRGEFHAGARAALVIAALAGAWALYLLVFDGVAVEILGLRIRSHNSRRPAILACAGLLVFMHLTGRIRAGARFVASRPWLLSTLAGGFVGGLVFLWIYLVPYSTHPAFPPDQLMGSFIPRDPSRWRGPLDFLKDLGAYDTFRPFVFACIGGILAWVPWFQIDRKSRISWLWLGVISLFVLMISVRVSGFTLWTFLLLDRLPGFSAIRDPKRMVYVYELALVLTTGVFLSRLRATSVFRIGISLLLAVLLVTDQNRETFESMRPIDTFNRWVAAPIDIDASCQSFFIKGASDEYMSRSDHMWSLYSVDSMFVALNYTLPTLNGYSAWAPEGWHLMNPQESGYAEALDSWIARHNLQAVCEFDIDRRTMRPYNPLPR